MRTGLAVVVASAAVAAAVVVAPREGAGEPASIAPVGFAPTARPSSPALDALFQRRLALPSRPARATIRRAATAPPPMTFTPNVRADAGEGATVNQNEPQVAVDQTGRSYVYWQGNNRLSSTDDGVNFSYLGNPIPNGNTGDTAVATTTWPSFTHTPSVAGSGDNGVFLSVLGSNLPCGVFQMHGGTSKDRGCWAARSGRARGTRCPRTRATLLRPSPSAPTGVGLPSLR